jgi:two-component system sensor histidine kinase KdpD
VRSRVIQYAAAVAAVSVVVIVERHFGLNATTVALSLLLVVLAAATLWGLAVAIATSVVAVLSLNFFFLPPVGTFTIEDPQNWIALATFLITAATASQLSARAQYRAAEAQERSLETERLYDLGRAILLNEQFDRTLERIALDIARIFELDEVAFYNAENQTTHRTGSGTSIPEEELKRVLEADAVKRVDEIAVTPVRLGGKPIGSLGLKGRTATSDTVVEAIANLAAISVERARAIERATMAEASRRNEELRAAMLDALAHDLKTPLTAIKASITTLISSPPRTREASQELLSIIHEETDRLNNTVSEAVQMARIDAGKVSLERKHQSVEDLVSQCVAEVRQAEVAARIDTRIPASLPGLDIDADLIRQVVKQLIDNAAKYSIPSGRIEISATEETDSIVLSVADHGPGVSADEQFSIFEKFYRGRHGSKTMEGTGMGLSIAKGIVEAHGGKIWVESNQWGGATFSFRLRKAGAHTSV